MWWIVFVVLSFFGFLFLLTKVDIDSIFDIFISALFATVAGGILTGFFYLLTLLKPYLT